MLGFLNSLSLVESNARVLRTRSTEWLRAYLDNSFADEGEKVMARAELSRREVAELIQSIEAAQAEKAA